MALAKSPLPSASIRILPSPPVSLANCVSTKMSLTAVQAMVSMPLPFSSSTRYTKPGMCCCWQVGV